MKTAIVGTGSVGKACAMATVLRGCSRELVLLDRNHKLAQAVAMDMQYGSLLSPRSNIHAGDYSDLNESDVVMVTVGVNEKTGGATDRSDPAGRLKLLAANKAIFKEVIPKIVTSAPEAVILIVSDPPEPLADIARELAGHDRVLSAGTFLDTLRFKFHIARQFKINPVDVDAWVIGEHGTSSVFLWSSAVIAGTPIVKDFEATPPDFIKNIEDDVKFANITIIEGNDASQYGIGMVCARIAEIIVHDEQTIIPIGSYQAEFGVVLSLPSIVGRRGVQKVLMPTLSEYELQRLNQSAHVLQAALKQV
jgi:L-lactate dehydrogenase